MGFIVLESTLQMTLYNSNTDMVNVSLYNRDLSIKV